MPLLDTRDLILRPPVPEDAPEAFELLNDADVARFNPERACPDLETAAQWCADGADWSDGTHATFHAVDRETLRMVGNVSLFAFDRDERLAKIGYRVLPSARGRGVARQMVDAVAGWAFAERDVMRIQLDHVIDNPASCRAAEAAGFLLEGTARSAYSLPGGGRQDCHVHARISTDPPPSL